MSPRDEMAADALADAETIDCGDCGGHGYTRDDDRYYGCDSCGGTGAWVARLPMPAPMVRKAVA